MIEIPNAEYLAHMRRDDVTDAFEGPARVVRTPVDERINRLSLKDRLARFVRA